MSKFFQIAGWVVAAVLTTVFAGQVAGLVVAFAAVCAINAGE